MTPSSLSNRLPRLLADAGTLRARLRPTLIAALGLASLAALAAWSGFDTRLAGIFADPRQASAVWVCCDAYSRWGPFVFYLSFLAVLGLGTLWRSRPLRDIGVAYLSAQFFGAVLLTRLLKAGIARSRPHAQPDIMAGLADALHSSFPSSHTGDVAVGAFLVLLLVRSRSVQVIALALAMLMALARVGLGRHFPSDVLAGLALGAATAALCVWLYLLPRWRVAPVPQGVTPLTSLPDAATAPAPP